MVLLNKDSLVSAEREFGRRRNVELAYERVRDAILRGRIQADTPISQVLLARQLGISRNPLREAMRLLEREGLVASEVNHRVRVTGLSVDDFEQLYAIRIGLEALAVRLTVSRLVEEDVRGLDENLAEMEEFAKAEDFESWEVPHRAFHVGLVAHAGDRLVGMISQLSDHAERYRRSYIAETPQAWSTTVEDHAYIFDACKSGQPDIAAQRLARHYSVVALSLLSKLAPEHDPIAVRTALRTAMGSHQ